MDIVVITTAATATLTTLAHPECIIHIAPWGIVLWACLACAKRISSDYLEGIAADYPCPGRIFAYHEPSHFYVVIFKQLYNQSRLAMVPLYELPQFSPRRRGN